MTLLDKLILLIDAHYQERHGPEFYGQHLNMTPQALNRYLKKRTGHTLHKLTTNRLLNDAMQLLGTGESTVKEVTYALGFSDAAQFCKFFKKHTRLRPSEYRLSDQPRHETK